MYLGIDLEFERGRGRKREKDELENGKERGKENAGEFAPSESFDNIKFFQSLIAPGQHNGKCEEEIHSIKYLPRPPSTYAANLQQAVCDNNAHICY